MIPPLQDVRLRSISRWLKDQSPTPQTEALDRRARELDEQMVEAFEAKEDSLKASMMTAGTWGTEEGMAQFPTDRMTAWAEVVAEFLAETSGQPSED